MSFFKSLLGPGKKEIWSELCSEMGFEFVNGGFWKTDRIIAKLKNWEIVLDTFTVSNKNNTTHYTRIRAPFVNPSGLRFKIYRKGLFSSIGKLLGMQDIKTGIPGFDDDFIIKGNDSEMIKVLFSGEMMVKLLNRHRQISIEIKNNEGFFGSKYGKGVDLLYFQQVGIIKDKEILKSLLDLFAETLNQMVAIGTATDENPQVKLK